jgi:hypothetical protein
MAGLCYPICSQPGQNLENCVGWKNTAKVPEKHPAFLKIPPPVAGVCWSDRLGCKLFSSPPLEEIPENGHRDLDF